MPGVGVAGSWDHDQGPGAFPSFLLATFVLLGTFPGTSLTPPAELHRDQQPSWWSHLLLSRHLWLRREGRQLQGLSQPAVEQTPLVHSSNSPMASAVWGGV